MPLPASEVAHGIGIFSVAEQSCPRPDRLGRVRKRPPGRAAVKPLPAMAPGVDAALGGRARGVNLLGGRA